MAADNSDLPEMAAKEREKKKGHQFAASNSRQRTAVAS
jgi:hypothetical protein